MESRNHEYVDLGLPSGILWATENIKADNGDELYFAWGETTGYTAEQVDGITIPTKIFSDEDYKYGLLFPFSKYNGDDKSELEPIDDAAAVNWGDDWRIPTKEEFEELMENTTHVWTKDYNKTGVEGVIFSSKINGNTLFFPADGHISYGEVDGLNDWGMYWSSSMEKEDPSFAYGFYLGYINLRMYRDFRSNGYSIRPISSNGYSMCPIRNR